MCFDLNKRRYHFDSFSLFEKRSLVLYVRDITFPQIPAHNMTRLDESKLQALQRAHEKGIVVGLKDVANVVPRLDIDVLLVQKPQTFNLFILAFDKLQRESSSTEKMGYFQIAGISTPSPTLLK